MAARSTLALFAVLGILLLAHPAAAQFAGGLGHAGGGGGGGSGDTSGTDPAPLPMLKPVQDPRQRLDSGALLCPSEAALKQHQAAIMARLTGGHVVEPIGCRFMGNMVAVHVVARDGQAVTEVRIPGQPDETGWTDAVVRDDQTTDLNAPH